MLVYQRVVGRDCGDGMIVNIVTDYGSFPQFRTFLAPLSRHGSASGRVVDLKISLQPHTVPKQFLKQNRSCMGDAGTGLTAILIFWCVER